MARSNDSYTIFILPDPTSRPYSFSIRKRTCHYLVSFLSVAILVVAGFFAQSLSLLEDLAELNLLRGSNKEHRDQLQSLSNTVNDLKKQMTRLMELDRKLRVMTDLSPKSGGSGGVDTLAQGGPELQLTALGMEVPPGQEKGGMSSKMAVSLQQDMRRLKRQITEEEESFKELIGAISEIQSRWASTPSIWPAKGWVTSSFGRRISPFTGGLVMHDGLDIAARRGSSVIAPAAGVVGFVGYGNDFGRFIIIRHGFGKSTYFGHLDKQTVRVGQKVVRGEAIGRVGSTGQSTGPHLHYEVRINNIPVDPTRYILN